MEVLYKYLRRQHAKALLEKGTMRIGTLYEYRDTEKHGGIIGDCSEGKKSIYMGIENETWTPSNQPEFAKDFFNLGESCSINIQGVTLEKSTDSPDHYIYCTTEALDKNAMNDFGYDACVIIENPVKFFSAISKTIRHKAIFEGAFRCQYQSRRVSLAQDNGIHPAIIKDHKYESQREIRALWRPTKKLISPIIIECRKAAKYCKLM